MRITKPKFNCGASSKRFKRSTRLFEDVSKPSPSIDAMMISYGCVYKRSSKPVMKGSRVETVEAARKEYKELLNEGWKKTSIFNSYF